tara:strand:- start:2744 stop:3211 length:468 start_codon:yes stop_codon:yes gene_type:complete
MKSYCKVIQCAFDAKAHVDFNDSNGNAMDCNYFKVESNVLDGSGITGSGITGFYIAQPSGIYGSDTSTLALVLTASGTTDHYDAGIGGVIGSAGSTVEMSLASVDKAAGVLIWNKLEPVGQDAGGPGVTFIITYGNIKQANPKRDQDGDFYPDGI